MARMPENVVVAPSILLADFARPGAEVAAIKGGIREACCSNIEAIRSATNAARKLK